MGYCSAETSDQSRADLVRSRTGWVVWGIPGALFLVGIAWDLARAWLWVPSLTIAGLACVANAFRCGRLHCFVTGPVLLLGALATLASAAGMVAIDWRAVLAAVAAGMAVGHGLEWAAGPYAGSQQIRQRAAADRSRR